jgi:osmotically-inducible protein OsmY
VDSWAKRLAAQEAAHRVAAVLDVANDITVKRPGWPVLTDTELAQAVRHALEWDVLVPHDQITSTVSDGDVTLEDTLDNWRSGWTPSWPSAGRGAGRTSRERR